MKLEIKQDYWQYTRDQIQADAVSVVCSTMGEGKKRRHVFGGEA
jgi:hypothetical protein